MTPDKHGVMDVGSFESVYVPRIRLHLPCPERKWGTR